MAEPISTAINISKLILEKIAPFAEDEIKLLWGLNGELTKLGDLVSQIEAVQLDAEDGEQQDNQTKNWLNKLNEIMDETNQVLDYFSSRTNSKNSNQDGCCSALSYFISNPNPIVWVRDSFMARKIKSINQRLDGIIKNYEKIRSVIQNAAADSIQPLIAIPSPQEIGTALSWKFASVYISTIYIKNCPVGKHLPPFHHLPFLEELYFESIMVDCIDYGDENISSKSELFFPSLKKIWIWNCPNLKGWWKKKKDGDGRETEHFPLFQETEYFPLFQETEHFPLFPCISVVDIKQSPNLKWMPLFPTVSEKLYIVTGSVIPLEHTKKVCSSFKFLKKLWVSEVPDLECMEIELFPSLEYLWVFDCSVLREWGTKGEDGEASRALAKVGPSVIEFEIKNCPKLASLPQGMQLLSSSAKFSISGCPLLKQRYRTKTDQDWPQIATVSTDW